MKTITTLFAVAALAATAALPTVAAAQWRPWSAHRHAEREQWRDVAIAGGVVGLIGAATHNPTVAAIGVGGAIYGGIRYEHELPYGGYRYDHGYYGHGYYDHGYFRNDHRWDDRRWRDDHPYYRGR